MPDPAIASLAFPLETASVVEPLAAPRGTLATLLAGVDEIASLNAKERSLQDQLVAARLGIAAGLFTALRAKHAPTAQHCLRVALRCSSFGRQLSLESPNLDRLEIAALLHDIGKIGVPDHVLSKPGTLTEAETLLMSGHRAYSSEILAGFVSDPQILAIVRGSFLRFDRRDEFNGSGIPIDIPREARLLAIVDAYDSMVTGHVYRAAMPRERALAELYAHAGTQFDPQLVGDFAAVSPMTEAEINEDVSRRWTQQLQPALGNALWLLNQPLLTEPGTPTTGCLFQQRLLDAMHDGVIFVDLNHHVMLWNRGAERLSRISRESVLHQIWSCDLLNLRDTEGNRIHENHCPVHHVLQTGVQTFRRLSVTRDQGGSVTVDVHVFPVTDQQHRCFGVTVLMHDASSEATLEQRVQNLHEKATTDPLTGVNNRAEFDRLQAAMMDDSLRSGTPCSMIICDIDRFKHVNDIYGHQAGDEALTSFATLLRQHARAGDLVARYGGEEFVILCPDCDNASAARQAEQIRHELSRTPVPLLRGNCITASFGVTEIQMGDTPATMLRRADRALYQAKDNGRNRVVQLGGGLVGDDEVKRNSWLSWLQRPKQDSLLVRRLIATVPLDLLVEKIKGFISDHGAEIVRIEDNYVVLAVDGDPKRAASRHRSPDFSCLRTRAVRIGSRRSNAFPPGDPHPHQSFRASKAGTRSPPKRG